MQVIRPRKVHPVIVVGSGASGGMAAWNLTRKGINVLMLDAGTEVRSQHVLDARAALGMARAHRARGEKPPQFFLDTKEQPYLTPPDKPFELIRVWGHGGKTNVWGRVSLRYSDLDFKGPAKDGWEIPWPIELQGRGAVLRQGRAADWRLRRHDDSDALPGQQVPPCRAPPPRCGERLLQQAFGKANIPIVAGRRANMTQAATRASPRATTAATAGRAATPASFFNSADHLLPFALKTGQARAASRTPSSRACWSDDRGLAEGVQYFDRKTGKEQRVYGEGRRDGRERRGHDAHPAELEVRQASERLGNGSDVIGRYLCEQMRVHVARLPAAAVRQRRRRTTAASAASTSTCRGSPTV